MDNDDRFSVGGAQRRLEGEEENGGREEGVEGWRMGRNGREEWRRSEGEGREREIYRETERKEE